MAAVLDKGATRFFGMDLSAVGRFFRLGVAEAVQWRAFRWLTPEYPVLLIHPDGSQSVRLGVSAKLIPSAKKIRHVAIELPDASLLRRSLMLPRLSSDELRQAAFIDARSGSPFAEDDLAWAFFAHRPEGARVRVDIALTSKQIIEREIASKASLLGGVKPEIWVGGDHPFVMPGYGESTRMTRVRAGRRVLCLLAGLVLLQLAAVAITPALQTRQLALDAMAKEARLAAQVKTQAQMRSEFAKLSEQVQLLNAARGDNRDAVWLLNELTRMLPDDVSLARLELTGSSVRLTGQADNAAQLLEALGANAAFRDVRAPAGITRARGVSKESFTIEFSLAPTGTKS